MGLILIPEERKIKAVTFDIGDTLYPNRKYTHKTTRELAIEIDVDPDEFSKRWGELEKGYKEIDFISIDLKTKAGEILGKLFEEFGVDGVVHNLEKLRDWALHRVGELTEGFYETDQGRELGEALKYLKEEKCKTGIISNSYAELKLPYIEMLKHHGIKFNPELAIISQDIGYKKPDPIIFRHAAEKLKTKLEQICHFGDRVDEDGAALDAGYGGFIWVYGHRNLDPSKYDGKSIDFITVENLKRYLRSER